MLILNEKKVIEEIIKHKNDKGYNLKVLTFLLAKYCFCNDIPYDYVANEVDNYLSQIVGTDYELNKQLYLNSLKFYVDTVYKNKLELNSQEKININQYHLDLINSTRYDFSRNEKKLLFTLITLSLYNNKKWINISKTEIFKCANINISKKQQALMFHKFTNLGLIENSKKLDNNSVKLNLSEEIFPIVYEVLNLENLGNQYLTLTDSKYKQCAICGKIIIRKQNNSRIKYCKHCANLKKRVKKG